MWMAGAGPAYDGGMTLGLVGVAGRRRREA